jgi:sec-independent protein translocase protein TatA
MPNIGLPEILVVLVIALIVFGPKRLPEMGRSLGKGIREFKDSLTGRDEEDEPREIERPHEETRPLEGEVVHNRKS